MESLWKSSAFKAADLNYFEALEDQINNHRPSKGIYTTRSKLADLVWLKEQDNRTIGEWNIWLDLASPIPPPTTEESFALVISPRRQAPPGQTILDHPAILKYLSISKHSLQEITSRLNIHRSLVVLVDLGTPIISRIPCVIDGRHCQVYTLSVVHTLSHRTAMTVTYFPQCATTPSTTVQNSQGSSASSSAKGLPSKTHAMILGYDELDTKELKKRLGNCKESIFLPFTLIKAFLYIERKHRFAEVNLKISQFQSILQNYGRRSVGEEEVSSFNNPRARRNAQDPKNLIGLYIDVCTLKNELAAWRTQIEGFRSWAVKDFGTADDKVDIDPDEYLSRMVEEYEGRINRCDLVLQGASLAFQMETAHLSRVDAQNALRDGKQMKAIAVLTMVFLPGTFVATLLAVPEFENMKNTSDFPPWTWYLIIFLPLTFVVLGAYYVWINQYKSKDQKDVAAMG